MFGGSKSLKQARLFCDFQILSSAQRYFPWLVKSKKALKRPKAKTSWYNEWKWVFFFFKVWTRVPLKRVNRSVSCWKTVYERVFRKSFPVKKGRYHFWRRFCSFVLMQYLLNYLVMKHKYPLRYLVLIFFLKSCIKVRLQKWFQHILSSCFCGGLLW